jgi:hypothetical protein
MFTLKTLPALAVLALGSLALVPACAVAQADSADNVNGADSADDTDAEEGVTAEALSRAAKACTTDATCESGFECAPHCPIIPGRLHCELVGGTCAARCTRSSASLHGQTFASSDAAHSITFAANGTFQKTDGCDPGPGGITCNHIELTKGTYASSSTGKTVKLTSNLGTVETLSVETHCYEGLHDPGTGAILYPAL